MSLTRMLTAIALLSVALVLSPAEAMARKRIAILVFNEELRYENARRGFVDRLKKEGFREPAIAISTENAGGGKAKATEFAEKWAADKPDMYFTLGTQATIPVAWLEPDVPIVFSVVYDPVAAGIAKGWKSSGNNSTGSSTMLPASVVLKTLKQLRPVKRLAVLYTPGEKNSEFQLLELQRQQASHGIKILPVILTGKEEVPRIMPEVVRAVDAIYITGSKAMGASVQLIVAAANKAHVVTVTHLDDMVEKGVLLGVCADSYRLGLLAGKKAAMILRGAKPSAIPIDTEQKPEVIVNRSSAKAGNFQIPAGFTAKVTRFVD